MRVGVTGGRDYADRRTVARVLEALRPDVVLVHGAATGADSLCAEWWSSDGRVTEPHPADWTKYGRAAGAIRNQVMVDSGLDVLIAFPGGRGTADMVRRASRAGVKVIYACPAAAVGQSVTPKPAKETTT